MSEVPTKPTWACRRYGDYEHDWLDCYDCQESYEYDTHGTMGRSDHDRKVKAQAGAIYERNRPFMWHVDNCQQCNGEDLRSWWQKDRFNHENLCQEGRDIIARERAKEERDGDGHPAVVQRDQHQ